jgi:3-mercaptopyruvate sulfurtransferase SseA
VLLLQKRGVKNIKALLGGWNTWVADNNPVNRGDKP